MAVFLGAFPVLPGKEDDVRKFAQATMARRDEFNRSQQEHGVTKEEWSLQETPMGSLVVVRFEAADIEKSFTEMAESTSEFDVWFRAQVMEVSGVDLSAPPEGPLPEVVLDWSA